MDRGDKPLKTHKEGSMDSALPYAGTARIRFKGYISARAPLYLPDLPDQRSETLQAYESAGTCPPSIRELKTVAHNLHGDKRLVPWQPKLVIL